LYLNIQSNILLCLHILVLYLISHKCLHICIILHVECNFFAHLNEDTLFCSIVTLFVLFSEVEFVPKLLIYSLWCSCELSFTSPS